MALLVSTRILGKRKPLLDDFSVPPPDSGEGGEDLLLRHVIEHVVRHEVKQFERRQANRRFERVLSEAQMAEGRLRGKIDPVAKESTSPVDADGAVAAALQAFEDGLYLVVIDEHERRSLDERVHLGPDSRLVFIRLVFLAGA